MGINTIGGTCDCRCDSCPCCGGDWPEEFDVELSMTDVAGANGCDNCDTDLSGVFTVQKVDGECRWAAGVLADLNGGSPCNEWVYVFGCEPTPAGQYIISWSLAVEITCYSETQYKVEVIFGTERRRVFDRTSIPCWTVGTEYCTWRWERIIDKEDLDCTALADFSVSRSSVDYSWYPWCDTDDTLRADALITTV